MARKKDAKDANGDTKELKVSEIVMDKKLQPRMRLTDEAVDEYAESMTNGEALPPCLVMFDGERNWLCDGFHRVTAAKKLGLTTIACVVMLGTHTEAMWTAAAANMKHGVRRSNLDKRRAIAMALESKPVASLREVAEHCGVTHEMVRQFRQQIDAVEEIERNAEIAVDDAIADGVVDSDNPTELRMVGAEAALKRCDEAISQAVRAVDALMSTPHSAFVAEQRLRTDLKNARTVIKQSLPHEVCPLCAGEGCETCRNCGWVTKQQWDLIPSNQRGN
jgi:ParB-like chromosome segregation protein Spo0J